ncbi:hypothetical protein XPA_008280 [Xanthoria parietina]
MSGHPPLVFDELVFPTDKLPPDLQADLDGQAHQTVLEPDDVTGSRGHSLVPTANKSRQLILLKQRQPDLPSSTLS